MGLCPCPCLCHRNRSIWAEGSRCSLRSRSKCRSTSKESKDVRIFSLLGNVPFWGQSDQVRYDNHNPKEDLAEVMAASKPAGEGLTFTLPDRTGNGRD